MKVGIVHSRRVPAGERLRIATLDVGTEASCILVTRAIETINGAEELSYWVP